MNNLKKCTRCGRELTNLRMGVTLFLETDRLKDNGIWENVANLTQSSKEYLCEDCFSLFADTLTGALNHKYEDPEEILENPCNCGQ